MHAWGRPRSSAKDRETCESVAAQWSWRSYREQRSRRGEYDTVMLETPVYHAVAEYSRERQTLWSVYEWTDNFQPKGRWWTEDSLCTQDAWCSRTQQKAPGPSETQKEHDDRGEADHEEFLKHTKKAIHPERDERWWHDVNDLHTQRAEGVRGERCSTARTARPASPDAACEGPCKQREVNRSGAERGTTLEELQENMNQKIPEVTRN